MIRIVEVGPRDGLQNEKSVIPLDVKVDYINRLSATGLKEIEAGAFVSADRIPQMADSDQVFESIDRKPGVIYSALVPNETGLDRALIAEVDKIAVFTAASETFNRKNINASIAESIERFKPVIARARQSGLPIRAYVSTAFWCPYEGKIEPVKALEVCRAVLDLGSDEVSIGDTIGKATADDVKAFLDLAAKELPTNLIFLHFHDTFGKAADNAVTAWKQYGITGFDSSAGGIGGCPYAPGAAGNVATERLLTAFKEAGAPIPADPASVSGAAAVIAPYRTSH